MSESEHTLLDSIEFSLPSRSESQSNLSTILSKSNFESAFLELSHPPLSQMRYDAYSPDGSWNKTGSYEDEEPDSDFPSQLSELSIETSPSLRSVHLPTNHRVSSLYYGMQLTHNLSLSTKKQITASVYSERAQKFIMLDHAGVIAWCPESNQLDRVHQYPPYKHNLFLEVSFSVKYNVYFILTKARHIITFNSHFEQVNSTRCIENSLLHLLFIETRSALIGAGVNGVSFWSYKRIDPKNIGARIRTLKPTENYSLYPSGLTKVPEEKLIRKVTISHEKRWIFALSFYDVFVISFDGKLLKSFLNLHKQTITDCLYSTHYSFLLTVSNDSTLTLWSDSGFPIHVFNSAMKSNTAVMQHPLSPHLVIVATVKGFIKCYNLFTLEEEFTQYIMENPILKIDCYEMSKQFSFYAIAPQSVSIFDLNYFCEFWAPLRNSLTSICFYRGGEKSERFHALCRDGTIRIYSITESRPLSVVLPPPDISFPSSAGSVSYDRNANLVYILLGPQEIWVYTTKTNPACRLEVYSSEVMSNILAPRDPEKGLFVATGVSSHNFIPHCTCLHVISSRVSFPGLDGSRCYSDGVLLMLGLKDGRVLFATTNQSFCKLFEIQASVGEVVSLRFLESDQILSQSVSVGGFIINIWSLPGLKLEHSLEVHSSLLLFWKVQDILLSGFSDGTLSLSSLKGMGSSLGGRSDLGERDKSDEIVSIHGVERYNIFCTAHKSGVVKIWDHHKNLMKVIALNGSLNGAYFLNNKGDLLVSINRHLYLIKQEYVLSSVSLIHAADTTHVDATALTDSAIFEDPNCKNGQLVATKHGFYYVDTMESYLKPYDIDLHGPNGLAILDQLLQEDGQDSYAYSSSLSQSSEELFVPLSSQLFISETETPLELSYDHFPMPKFSSPTPTPRVTPPASEVDEKEVVRAKIAALNETNLQDIALLSHKDTSKKVEKIEQGNPLPKFSDAAKSISPIENQNLISNRVVPTLGAKLAVIRPSKPYTIDKPVLENRTELSKREVQQNTSSPSLIQAQRPVKRRDLRRRKADRSPKGQSEILANMDGVNYASTEVERAVEREPVGGAAVGASETTAIREVRTRGVNRKRPSSIRSSGKRLSNADTVGAITEEACDKRVEISQGERAPLHSIDSNASRSVVCQETAKIRFASSRVFAMNKYTDFSRGWQEREYVRRLGYRMRQHEKSVRVWAYQANLRESQCVRKSKLEPSSSHEYQSLSLSHCIDTMNAREGVQHASSRSSTPFLSSTPFTHSSSSFYAYKHNLEVKSNFRLRASQVNVRVPPNSRCTSAPPITTSQYKFDF